MRYVLLCTRVFILGNLSAILRRLWVVSPALSDAGHAEDPPVRHGPRLGPGWLPAVCLWALKVAQSEKGLLSADLEPSKTMENPHDSRFAPLL